jgi:small subunit ribosomal protein S21
MLIIKQERNDTIERMLKRFKRKFEKTKVLKTLRAGQEFVKPSVEKRKEKNKAIYKNSLNLDNED